MVMESYDCDLWRRYTWEAAKFRFYGRPAYRAARQWTAKCSTGAVVPPNNDTRKRRKSPRMHWDPSVSEDPPVFFSSSFLFRFVSRRSTYSATTLSNYNTYAPTIQKLGDRLLVFGDVSGYREFVKKFDQIYNKQLRISEKHTFASIIVYERFT